jgi:APA family basic amino acid/polyamine antiporter
MPAVLAGAGTSSLITLAVIAGGAMLLAALFGQLTRRVPNSEVGCTPTRREFGDIAGYLTGWRYWIQAWAGNAAIVSAWVFYMDALFGITRPSAMTDWASPCSGCGCPRW